MADAVLRLVLLEGMLIGVLLLDLRLVNEIFAPLGRYVA
jgi:hypothetical protein